MRRITLAVALVGTVLAGMSPAGAAPITCGTTITASTTLTADLTCAGDALVIADAGVVLDLGGHTITGGGFAADGAAVRAQGARATVRNGRIQNFRYAVLLSPGSDGSLVERLALHGNGDGVRVESSQNRIRGNSIIRGTNVAVFVAGNANVIEANSMLENIAGVFMIGFGNDVLRNDIVGEEGDDRGILAFQGARIIGNRVSRYAGAAGIELLNGGEVIGNQVFANVDGIRVGRSAVVTGNTVVANADDGIELAPGASAVVGSNTAVRNVDLGISAAGATDAGGNRASANGNPLQCVGVVCS
jgi:hypothetical protein